MGQARNCCPMPRNEEENPLFSHKTMTMSDGNFDDYLTKFMDTLPKWTHQLWLGNIFLSPEELVEHIQAEVGKWWDDFPVSVLGTNQSGGHVPLTDSEQPGPRRMMLSSEINGEEWSKLHKCNVESLPFGVFFQSSVSRTVSDLEWWCCCWHKIQRRHSYG